jgi:group II intron reverse transcriptase/maturase/CRISPR-associated endonuclease Cas1
MNTTRLYNKLCNTETLWDAWKAVKSKNTQGGIDAVSVKNFEANANKEINKVRAELIEGTYNPRPYKSTSIPKSEGKNRELGLLTVRDKIVQYAANEIIYPIIDKHLTKSCYAYRHKKGAVKAVRRVKHLVLHEHYSYVLSCDIKSYFDCINHNKLSGMLESIIPDEKMLDFLSLCIKMGKIKHESQWIDRETGIPQGSNIAPVLANLYLTPLDKAIEKYQVGYVRYADDFVILSKSKSQLEDISLQIKKIIESELKLKLKNITEISSIKDGFCFLGIQFTNNSISINVNKKERMKQKIASAFDKQEKLKMKLLKKQIDGYKSFYGRLLPETEIQFIDEALLKLIKNEAIIKGTKTTAELRTHVNQISFVTNNYQRKKDDLLKSIVKDIQKTNPIQKTHTKLIAKRKREYQKLEAQNMELIINAFGTYIGVSSGKVNIRKKGEKIQRIPLANLNHISILSNGVSISSDLIYKCAHNKTPISFFSRDGKHYATLYNPVGADSSLWHHQINAESSAKGLSIAASLVNAKIRNQANLLKYFYKYHKKNDKGFASLYEKRIDKLAMYAKNAKEAVDIEHDNYRQNLLSIEAQAAIVYWELVAELINDDSDFSGRERKGAKDLVNSLLNYGYAILYSRVWKAIIAAKLNPYISYLHVSASNKPTLSFDLVEVFRQQAVDRVVITMLQKKEKLVAHDGILDKETRSKLAANIYERLHRFEKFRGENRRLSDVINMQALALAKYLKGQDKKFKPYIAKW